MADGWGPPAAETPAEPIPTPAVDAGWGPPAATQGSSAAPEPQLPMPGPIDALMSGLKRGVSDVGQSAEVVQGKAPTQSSSIEAGPEAGAYELRDIYEPYRGLSKLAYQTGASGPTLAGGVAGGLVGSLAGPVGTAIGGIGGSAAGAAFQTIGPAFAQELKKTPTDPDAAWDRAVKLSAVSGAFSGASWGAYPLKFFSGPVKNLAFQVLGVQPGLSMAHKATENVIEGEEATKGLGQAYAQGAVTTAVPAIGHLGLRGRFGEPKVTDTEPTPAQIANQAAEYQQKAADLRTQAAQPGLSQGMIDRLTHRANEYDEIASVTADRNHAKVRAEQDNQWADIYEQQAQNPALNPIQQRNFSDQAKFLRESARHDAFIGSIPPPLPRPGGGLLSRIKESYLNNVAPEARSELALQADPVIARYKSMKSQAEDSIIHMGDKKYYYKWEKVSEPDVDRFYKAYQTGTSLPPDLVRVHPWMKDAYVDYRKALQDTFILEKDVGSKANYLENYFGQIWKRPDWARNVFQPERLLQSMGANWFQKARTFDLIEMGKQAGLELVSNNPQELINMRLKAGADMINKMEMLHELQKIGAAVPAESAPAQVRDTTKIGGAFQWEPVKSPTGESWLVAPEVTPLWKNGVEAKGLWQNETGLGSGFRGWMKVKNAWIPIKLGLSAFHFVHVLHINQVNNLSRGLRETFGSGQQSLLRRVMATPEALLQTVADPLMALPIGTPHIGKTMRESWLTPKGQQTPAQKANVALMNDAGISAQLSEQLRIAAKRDFNKAWNEASPTLPWHGFRRGMEKLSGWMFEEWIPNLKLAALQRESAALFRRRPDLIDDPQNRRLALRAIGKQIDNRFGEMYYGGLFWNRNMKDALIGSFLSLGWNLGFVREFGGGAFEPIARRLMEAPNPSRKLIRETTNKTSNMIMYTMTAFLANAALQKAFTGENPSDIQDLIFPRIGGLNPDGSPRRVTNAFYTREVPMATKNIEEQQSTIKGLAQLLQHKMLFAPFIEMGRNRDYFGSEIYDENAPAYKQAWQFINHLGSDTISPMSVTGATRALQLSGKPHSALDVIKQAGDRDVLLPFLGFGPAPGYASKSPLENRIMHLFRKYVAPEAKSYDVAAHSKERSEARTAYLGAIQRGDDKAKIEAAQKLAALGVATKEINKLQPGGSVKYMFQRLPRQDQKALLIGMSPAEFKTYFPKANKQLRGDPEVMALARRYASIQ